MGALGEIREFCVHHKMALKVVGEKFHINYGRYFLYYQIISTQTRKLISPKAEKEVGAMKITRVSSQSSRFYFHNTKIFMGEDVN
jgi:hypothetical protein